MNNYPFYQPLQLSETSSAPFIPVISIDPLRPLPSPLNLIPPRIIFPAPSEPTI